MIPRISQIVSASFVLKSVLPRIFLDIDAAEIPALLASSA